MAAATAVTILAVVGTPFTGGLSVAGGAVAASALVATAVTVAETSAVVGLISIFTASTIEVARNTSSVIGSSGTQTSSTTTWKGDGKERIDVENPNPGIRDGNIHYHDSGNMKYCYDITKKVFKNVTPRLKKLIQNRAFQNGIKKALNILGEQ